MRDRAAFSGAANFGNIKMTPYGKAYLEDMEQSIRARQINSNPIPILKKSRFREWKEQRAFKKKVTGQK
jgi:hypothetical protein